MTEKQKTFMMAHGLFLKLKNLGLNPDSLSTSQASGVIAKFYEDQKREQELERTRLRDKLENEEALDKMLGITPDFDAYPGCGFDRSWVG